MLVAGAAVGVVTALVLRTRVPGAVVLVVLVLCGVTLASGGLLVLDHVSTTNIVLTEILLAVLVPAHVRVVLGSFGPRHAQ